MSSPRRRPTQTDVARRAGVSQAVVSYVLNGNQQVSILPETRQRVLDAIAELGYVPNSSARSLRSARTNTIAVIIPDITNPFYPEFLRGVQDVVREAGYDVLASNTDGEPDRECSALNAARRARVDGLIAVTFFIDLAQFIPVLEEGTPIAMLAQIDASVIPEQLPLDTISISGEDAAGAVVSYLIEKGHTRIGMIAGRLSTPPRESRVRGYRQALVEHHVPLEEVLIRGGDFTEEGGYEAMKELLQLPDRPTAVFAANDLMAMGALLACREAGVRVPDDIALAGFDDIPAAKLVHPALTTLDQHARASGQRAAEILLTRLNGEYTGPRRHEDLGFTLIPRASA